MFISQEYDAYKRHMSTLLGKEKELNTKLRVLIGWDQQRYDSQCDTWGPECAALINHCVTACMPQASQENNKTMQTKRYKGSIGLAKNKGIRDTITLSVLTQRLLHFRLMEEGITEKKSNKWFLILLLSKMMFPFSLALVSILFARPKK